MRGVILLLLFLAGPASAARAVTVPAPLQRPLDCVRSLLDRLPRPRDGSWPATRSTRPPPRGPADIERFVGEATEEEGWAPVVSRDGFQVSRRNLRGSRHVYVRGQGVFGAPPEAVIGLFETSDAALIRRYNPLYDSGWDLERYDSRTKAAYAKVRAACPGVRPRDTVSLISRRDVGGGAWGCGGTVFFQEATTHPAAPPLRGVVRAKILRGMFLVQPVPGCPRQTRFTFTQQCDAGGVIPSWLMNRLIVSESIHFLQRLDRTAKGR